MRAILKWKEENVFKTVVEIFGVLDVFKARFPSKITTPLSNTQKLKIPHEEAEDFCIQGWPRIHPICSRFCVLLV